MVVEPVVSSSFARVDEAERQRDVWAFLRRHFAEGELTSVEFIFTNAPDEDDAEPEDASSAAS